MKIIIVFKTGFSLTVTCEEFAIERNILGEITGYKINGIKDHKPLHFNWADVLCIYRDLEGELNGEKGK